jgi:hypothetical protein
MTKVAKMMGKNNMRNWKTLRRSRYKIVDEARYGAIGLGDQKYVFDMDMSNARVVRTASLTS